MEGVGVREFGWMKEIKGMKWDIVIGKLRIEEVGEIGEM